MRQNWQKFLDITDQRTKAHRKAAVFWDNVHHIFSLVNIFLGAVVAAVSLMKKVPQDCVTVIASITTVLATITAFLKPAERSQIQTKCSKEFNNLLLSMVRCETEEHYEQLWRDLNKAILDEPFVSTQKKKKGAPIDWTMTPELMLVVADKEDLTKQVEGPSLRKSKVDRNKPPSDDMNSDKPIKLVSKTK